MWQAVNFLESSHVYWGTSQDYYWNFNTSVPVGWSHAMAWERTTRRSPVAWSEQPSGWRQIHSVDLLMCSTWSNSPGPSMSSLFTLLLRTSCCCFAVTQFEYWRGRSCKTATVSLWGQNWSGKFHVQHIAFAKHTCLVFRTQCSLGELICSIMLVLPSCIRGRVSARWTQGREMSDPIRTSQKATGMSILNENGENAPCSSQRSTAQWSNAAEERLLPRTQIDKLCSAYFLERRPESILCLLWDLLAECFGSCFCLSGVFATLATICWHCNV